MATVSIRSRFTSSPSRKKRSRKENSCTDADTSSNLKEAIEVLEKGMKGTLADYEIASVTETALMDIFPYDAEDDKNTDKTADATIHLSANSSSPYLKDVRRKSPYRERRSS